MPELGTITGARAASLAGLAPVTRESGWTQLHSGKQAPRAPIALHARHQLLPYRHAPAILSALVASRPPVLTLIVA